MNSRMEPVPAEHQPLIDALEHAAESAWLASARAQVMQGHIPAARNLFAAAVMRFPASQALRLGLAGSQWQLRQHTEAEATLREWLSSYPADGAAALLLAKLLREQGRLQAVADVIRGWAMHSLHDTDTLIQAIELLDDYSRPREAAWICEAALAEGNNDVRLHAYAGMLAIQLGDFTRVREHYDVAMRRHPGAVEWNIPIGLSTLQRYQDAQHPDFAFFQQVLSRADISDKTRMTTLFAWGKAFDDIGDYAQAVECFRRANAIGHAGSQWSRKAWRRQVDARLASAPHLFGPSTTGKGTPVFIVGVPRSGTTLLAELLARHPKVRNRGELGWLQLIAQRLLDRNPSTSFVQQQASLYEVQLQQDDGDADWYIDKQPLNLLHVDLILSLWPHARILYCRRQPRDVALSLWTQTFHDKAHDYAYDMGDIAALIHGCERLMNHWRKRYPYSIHAIEYERLVNAPDAVTNNIQAWLGLPESERGDGERQPIRTASAWQARQPVYTHSVARWRRYFSLLPELAQLPER